MRSCEVDNRSLESAEMEMCRAGEAWPYNVKWCFRVFVKKSFIVRSKRATAKRRMSGV